MEQRDPDKGEPSLRYNFEKAKNAGYDGLCLDLTLDEIDDFQEVHNLYDEFNLGCMINAFPLKPSDMKPLMRMAKRLNAPLINIISGIMPLKPEDAVSCVKAWLKEANENDINILFETPLLKYSSAVCAVAANPNDINTIVKISFFIVMIISYKVKVVKFI